MKKLMSLCLLSVLSAPALADVTPLFKVYGGVNNWSAEFAGDLGESGTDISDLGFDDESNVFFYAGFEHPVPLLPNIKIERTSISSTGNANLTDVFDFGDTEFSDEVTTDIDLTFTDGTLYYDIMMVQFGLTLRQLTAEVSAESEVQSEAEEVDAVLPMVYLGAEIELPLTGLYILGNVNTISYDDKSMTDFRGGVGYGLELGPLAELGLELGYRSLTIDVGEEEDFEGEIELDGVYFGLRAVF